MFSHALIKPIFRLFSTNLLRPSFLFKPVYHFSTLNNSLTLGEQLKKLSNTIRQDTISNDYSQMIRNYLELSEQSFIVYVKEQSVDPQLLLMFMSTFENHSEIKKFIPLLYPYVDLFQKKQMLLLFEYIISYKPLKKPKIPHPKNLQSIESILVILSTLYPCDSLIKWLQYIPVYEGDQVYVLSMGYYSILQKLSPENCSKHQNLLKRCQNRIQDLAQNKDLDVRAGVAILALELNYPQALRLLFKMNLDIYELQPQKLFLMLINMCNYRLKSKQLDTRTQNTVNKLQKQIVIELATFNLLLVLKLQLYLALWRVIKQIELKGAWKQLVDKLCSMTTQRQFQRSLANLKEEELLVILEGIEKHKLNKQNMLKHILAFFTNKLETMEKKILIRLTKVLVTYVRQCQNYLIDVRKIIERRKVELSTSELKELNEIFQRVKVLFPRML